MRVCAAAMPAAEHSLKINADRSGAALFCIASHRQSDEDTADHRLGDGIQHVKSNPVRLLGNAIGRHLNFGLHVTVAAMWTVPRRHQLRLDAEAGASQHTTAARQSHRVRPPFTSTAWKCGTATAALHRSAHAHQRRILLSTWQPIQHRCGGSLVSAHPQNTNASHFFDVLRTCVPLSTRNLCRRPCIINWQHQSRLREMLLLMNYTAYVTLLGYPTTTIALLLFNIVISSGTL
ncbi:hypothetical protein TCDM_10582 [Trypanosoma cruzi Dm28c]|uniref:Uncharacterized protein n=1 Tax=Trypanosoma cruzi Dm28c TaxID=1416333 RepID=V5D2T1_TRYCR|nr:hypothetical protein TCDM_10582 [Trypanosoma cruzi Dm28c]